MKNIVFEGETQIPTLADGPTDAEAVLILAHGAGAPMDSPFMESMAQGFAQAGQRCIRFEFPYMAKRRTDGKKRPPDRAPKLIDVFAEVVATVAAESDPATKIYAGGKSMGGRMATLMAAEEACTVPVSGLVALGYPFHPPGRPEKLRTDHFHAIKAPVLICQGERDTFGAKAEVSELNIPKSFEIQWLADGNHDLAPRKKSGFTHEQNLETAITTVCDFMKR